jgi:hypothetical protein
MNTDREVKDAIGGIWTAASTALGESVRVVKTWKLSLRGKEVMSALRSLSDNKKINGVYITRVRRLSKRVGMNKREYKWVYAMYYFRSYDDSVEATNSEDKANTYIEKVAELLEASGDLGLEYVDDHEEMQIENIDTIDLRVHAFQCFLTVNLTNQPG